jgi:hypothetical protein
MGIARIDGTRQASEQTPVTIIQKIVEPVIIASKKFYQTNPKETLELAIFFIFLLLTFIGQISRGLPILWYIVLSIMAIRFIQINQLKEFIKKRKKK